MALALAPLPVPARAESEGADRLWLRWRWGWLRGWAARPGWRARELFGGSRIRVGRRFALFEDLFDVSHGPQVLVVTFIAMLELSREHLLEVTQAEAFAPIYVRLAYQPA